MEVRVPYNSTLFSLNLLTPQVAVSEREFQSRA